MACPSSRGEGSDRGPFFKLPSGTFGSADKDSDRSPPSNASSTPAEPRNEDEAVQKFKDRTKSFTDRYRVHLELGNYAKAHELHHQFDDLQQRAHGNNTLSGKVRELAGADFDRICRLDSEGQSRIARALAAEKEAERHTREDNYAASIAAYREALDIYRTLLGPKSWLYYLTHSSFIWHRHIAGNGKELRELHQEDVRISRTTLGDRHPLTGESLLNLGILEAQLQLHSQAEVRVREALDIYSTSPETESKDTAYCHAVLAEIHNAMADFSGAEREAREAITVASVALPSRIATLIRAQAALGRSCMGQRRWAEAEKALARALDLQALLESDSCDDVLYAQI